VGIISVVTVDRVIAVMCVESGKLTKKEIIPARFAEKSIK
jgi:hypothetical protein